MYSLKYENFPLGTLAIYDFISKEEIEEIHEFASSKQSLNGAIQTDRFHLNTPSFISYSERSETKNEDKKHRNSDIVWINSENHFTMELFKKIIDKVISVNEEKFLFNITDIEPLQYTIYKENQFYKKHVDLGEELLAGGLQRKLSFIIQLSDPSEYEGGEVLCYSSEIHTVVEKDIGSITFFPSFLLHEVTPVTKGKRVSLVGWVSGPRFV